MARPERHDVDYFPFYVKDGKTLFILEERFGCKGVGFFTNVMRFLCQRPDHYFRIEDDSDRLYFFAKVKCDEESGMEMLDIMAKTRKLHTSLWVSYKVIVSPDLLDSLKDAYRNRKNDIISLSQIVHFYIPDVNNTHNTEFLTSETPQHEDNQPLISRNNPQTKLKETKLNIYSRLFDFWNSCKIIEHRSLTSKMETSINVALKDFKEDEILNAIKNYSEVLKSSDHFFKYRWTLEDFLRRGLRKFIDSVDPKTNYRNNASKNSSTPNQPHYMSKEDIDAN
jgi:hypothetical protein